MYLAGLLSLEQQDSAMSEVEVDEVLRFCISSQLITLSGAVGVNDARWLTVSNKGAKVPADNAMPCCALPFVELVERLDTVPTCWRAVVCE